MHLDTTKARIEPCRKTHTATTSIDRILAYRVLKWLKIGLSKIPTENTYQIETLYRDLFPQRDRVTIPANLRNATYSAKETENNLLSYIPVRDVQFLELIFQTENKF